MEMLGLRIRMRRRDSLIGEGSAMTFGDVEDALGICATRSSHSDPQVRAMPSG